MKKFVSEKYWESILKNISSLSTSIVNINLLWDGIFEEYSKHAAELVKEGHTLHISFYHFMQEISNDCDKNVSFFENIIEEFTIAKKNEAFDLTFTEELKESTNKILENLDNKTLRNERLSRDIQVFKDGIEDKKTAIQNKIDHGCNPNLLISGAGAGATSGMVLAGTIATGATMGMAAPILLGAVAGSLLFSGILKLIGHFKKKNLLNLCKLLDELMNAMSDMEKEIDRFKNTFDDMAHDIKKYLQSIDKCIRYSYCQSNKNKIKGARVVVMSDNMIRKTEEMKASFEKTREEAKMNESGLRKLILQTDPSAYLTDK